jgi:hypothetical protein
MKWGYPHRMIIKFLVLFVLLLPLPLWTQGLPYPGFEEGAIAWNLDGTMSTLAPEAARESKMGLRVTDESATAGSSAISSRLPVQPGQEITLTFWSKTQSNFIAVYYWFYNSANQVIKDPTLRAGGGLHVHGVKPGDGSWQSNTFNTTIPPEAVTVALWIHSFGSSTGTADFDDFSLAGIAPDAVPILAVTTPPKTPPPPIVMPARDKPPVIIIKADDLRPIDGKLNGLWLKFASFIESRNLKAGIGVNTSKLSEASPEFVQWVKDKQASGTFEFWFHGWDHGTHEVEGKPFCEFSNRTYEEQKKRFDDSQALALVKFGFPFVTFGPPGGASTGGSFDANTIRVMQEDPHMKVWLYPQPLDEPGSKLEAAGKVKILDRVWAVNIESKVGQPDFQKFAEGYAKNPDREYYVLQGHPMHWGSPERYAEFAKIIDLLVEQKAVFMTPSEFAAQIKGP